MGGNRIKNRDNQKSDVIFAPIVYITVFFLCQSHCNCVCSIIILGNEYDA